MSVNVATTQQQGLSRGKGFFCNPRFVIKKLFTKEDPHFFHKVFGLLSVLSFIYRYLIVFPRQGNLGFDGSAFDWATMFCHTMLSSSSLIFRVLKRRIASKPMVIWQEYRLHAIVFTLRCLAVFTFGIMKPFVKHDSIHRVGLMATVLFWHLCADEITRRFGPEDKSLTTVRVNQKKARGIFTYLILRFYSFYQFAALGSHLIPTERTADLGFNTLVAIQSSAFLMTLFRKGLIRYTTHGIWYTICLGISMYHILLNFPSVWFVAKVAIAFAARCNFRMNKYVIWTAFVFVSIPAVEIELFDALASAGNFIAARTNSFGLDKIVLPASQGVDYISQLDLFQWGHIPS